MAETHIVEQGEYLASIAKDYGFSDWHTIYNHPQNASLKKKRPNPNVLLPGDEIFIPDKQLRQESCPTEKKHRFKVNVPKAWLKIVLKDADRKPIKNQPYTLIVAWLTFVGNTSEAGLVQEKIPIGVETGSLKLDKMNLAWNLKIGHLDPIEELDKKAIISGMQARLNNLGFLCGPIDGILGPRTRGAIRKFHLDVMKRKTSSGEPDDDTQQALLQHYGC